MNEQNFNQVLVRPSRAVILKWVLEALVLVATNSQKAQNLNASPQFQQKYLYKVAQGVLVVFRQNNVSVIVANASTPVIKLAKNLRVATTSPSLSEVLHINND